MKIFWSWIAFFIIIFISQIAISHFITEPWGARTLSETLDKGYDVLYFGDSTVGASADTDTDKAPISEMLARLKPKLSIIDLSRSSNHLGLYEAMIEQIVRSGKKPAVIIPINMRSFSPWYDKRPEFQFEKEIFYMTAPSPLVACFYKPLAVFRAIDDNAVTFSEFYQTPVYRGKKQVGIVADFNDTVLATTTPENIKTSFMLGYMFNLEPNHRKLDSLRNIIDQADRSGFKVYFYITPINHEQGEKFYGEEFKEQMKKNTDTICAILKEKNHPCANLAFSIDSSYFQSPVLPSEHLNQKGKMFVAEEVAKML